MIGQAQVEAILARGGIRIVYQPIVRLEDRLVVGYEALSRFPSVRGMVDWAQTPDRWFAAAHACGLGAELETMAVTCAVGAVPLVDPAQYVSVNVSALTLSDPDFARLIMASHPSRIVVELTEHDVIASLDLLLEVLENLRGHAGVGIHAGPVLARLAIDDVGAGHSGLLRIHDLAPDIIKLDRAMVAGVDRNPRLGRMCLAMVILAGRDMTVVAEGIEHQVEVDALWSIGITHGQGYLLGRPQPMAGIEPCEGLGC